MCRGRTAASGTRSTRKVLRTRGTPASGFLSTTRRPSPRKRGEGRLGLQTGYIGSSRFVVFLSLKTREKNPSPRFPLLLRFRSDQRDDRGAPRRSARHGR